MSGYPGFGILLTGLLDHKGLDVTDLASTENEKLQLQSVLDGAPPGLRLLRWLAPALGMHVPDLYVIAGMGVPQELAPLDAKAGPQAARLAGQVGHLPERSLVELLELARTLPQEDRVEHFPPPRKYEQYPPGFGGMLVHMLASRNLNWLSSEMVLYAVSLGRVYWSGATVGRVGRGGKEVTPALLPVFAAALGIPAGDLAALGGMRPPEIEEIPLSPMADVIAELVWETRRLTADQVKLLRTQAEVMRQG